MSAENSATTRCFFCGEAIPADALKCRACRSHVAFWGGGIDRPYWVLFFVELAILLGVTLVPWSADSIVATGETAPGYTTGPGAAILVGAVIVLATSAATLWTRRFHFTPLLLFFLTGTLASVARVMEVRRHPMNLNEFPALFDGGPWDVATRLASAFGPGFVLCALGFLFLPIYVIASALKGARAGAAARRR